MTFHSQPDDELTRGTVFKQVARLRAGESRVLLDRGHELGAVYLAGYAVECQLKYAVCERNGLTELPSAVQFSPDQKIKNLYVHRWSILLVAAQLQRSLSRQVKMEALFSKLDELWGPGLRYRTKRFKPNEASSLYAEIMALYRYFTEIQP